MMLCVSSKGCQPSNGQGSLQKGRRRTMKKIGLHSSLLSGNILEGVAIRRSTAAKSFREDINCAWWTRLSS